MMGINFIYFILLYMFLFSTLLFFGFMYLYMNGISSYVELNLMKFISLKMEVMIYLDWISFLFMSVVFMISSMVIMYSIDYVGEEDLSIRQFLMMILIFVMAMVIMILSPNLISILLGWDGLGLISYCLVLFYQSNTSFISGLVTVMTNRIGDIMILMSIGLMFYYGSWNFMFLEDTSGSLVWYMLIIASFTKSAQIPFSQWLPMAMAAPTPVSALVHSSTLVTAGIYLLLRLNHNLIFSSKTLNLIMLISVMTMFMSGLAANFEYDFKKIIALSTLSQLSLMFFSLMLKQNEAVIFHLLTHAMFKSLLFMCAGVIIHNMWGFQDIRYLSMTSKQMPLVSLIFIISTFSLCGIPFLSGFFSKDLILELYMMGFMNKFILMILFTSMGLTVSYSVRLIYYMFVKHSSLINHTVDLHWVGKMSGSMYLLFINSIIKGCILSWLINSNKNDVILPIGLKLMIYLFMMLGIFLSIYLKNSYFKLKNFGIMQGSKLLEYMTVMWFIPLMWSILSGILLDLMENYLKFIELGWLEYLEYLNLLLIIKWLLTFDLVKKNYLLILVFILIILLVYIFF